MISDLAKLYGLTPRAIRFYEERGLIQTSRDRLNTRRYDARARDRLKAIAELRRAGLGLDDIEEILRAGENGADAQRDCATHKLMARRLVVERMRKAVDDVAASVSSGAFDFGAGAVRVTEPRPAVTLRRFG